MDGKDSSERGNEDQWDLRLSSQRYPNTLRPRYEMPGCPFSEAENGTYLKRDVNCRRQATGEAGVKAANGRTPETRKDRCRESTFFFARSEPVKFLIVTVVHILASLPANAILLYLAWELHPATHKRYRRKRNEAIVRKTSEINEARAELEIIGRKTEESAPRDEKDIQVRIVEQGSVCNDDEKSPNQRMVENQQNARYARSVKQRISYLKGDIDKLYGPRPGPAELVWAYVPSQRRLSHTFLFYANVLVTVLLLACAWYSIILVPFEIHFMHYCGKPGFLEPVVGAMLWAAYILIVLSMSAAAHIKTIQTWLKIIRDMRSRAIINSSNRFNGLELGSLRTYRSPHIGPRLERQYAESAPPVLTHAERSRNTPQHVSRAANAGATGSGHEGEDGSGRSSGELRAAVTKMIAKQTVGARGRDTGSRPCNSRSPEGVRSYYYRLQRKPSISDSRSRLPSPVGRGTFSPDRSRCHRHR